MVGVPDPALNLALFLGSIMDRVTSGRVSAELHANLSCRRSPAGVVGVRSTRHLRRVVRPSRDPA